MTGRGEQPPGGFRAVDPLPADPVPVDDGFVEPEPAQAAAVFGPELERARLYAHLLATEGVTRGLVGPREPSRVWSRHLLNCAALAELLPAESLVLDLGSGAGLPGLPLALARPDLRVILLEPMARRVAFLSDVVGLLKLDRVSVRRGRAEDVEPRSVDAVVTRAVAPLVRLVPMSLPLLRPGGRLLALKGSAAEGEVAAAKQMLDRFPVATVSIVAVPAGAATATVVIVALTGDAYRAKGRKR